MCVEVFCFDCGAQENSPPSPPGVPSSSRSVARRVYAELQLVEQLYLLVDHERANDLTECLHFPSVSSSSITSATACLLAAPSSSTENHLHAIGLPSSEHQVHFSENLDTQPPPEPNLLGFLPSVTLPAPPPPAALLAALRGSPNSRENSGREKSAGCVDGEEEDNEEGAASQSRSHSKERSEREDGDDEEEEEMDETAREGGREEVFIVAKQKWKRRKRKRGKGGGSSSNKNKDEGGSEDSQSNSSPDQPGQQSQDSSSAADKHDKEGREEEQTYMAVDERIKMEPSSASFATCSSRQGSKSHAGSRRGGVSPSAHRVSPSGASEKPVGRSVPPARAEGLGSSLKQNSNSSKSSGAAHVKREPSDVSNTSGGSQDKSQLAKQKQKNSSAMSWLPAAFVDRKLTPAPLPSFTGRKK